MYPGEARAYFSFLRSSTSRNKVLVTSKFLVNMPNIQDFDMDENLIHKQSAEDHGIVPSFFQTWCSIPSEFGLTPSGSFSLRLTFQLSKSDSLRDVSVTAESVTLFLRFSVDWKINSKYYDIVSFPQARKARDSFSLFHINLRSLSAHLDELQLLLTALKLKYDVICISETKEQTHGLLIM